MCQAKPECGWQVQHRNRKYRLCNFSTALPTSPLQKRVFAVISVMWNGDVLSNKVHRIEQQDLEFPLMREDDLPCTSNPSNTQICMETRHVNVAFPFPDTRDRKRLLLCT